MTYGSSPRTKLLTADIVSYNKYHPFSALNTLRVNPVVGGGVRGVNKQDHYTHAQRLRIICDGTATEWSADDYAALENADVQATITNTNILTVNAVVNNGTLLTRKGSAATLAGGDCKVRTDASVNKFSAEKVGGGAFGAGTIIDVFLTDQADVVNQATVTGTEAEIECYDFMIADEATVISCI